MDIFNSYVKLPEGRTNYDPSKNGDLNITHVDYVYIRDDM